MDIDTATKIMSRSEAYHASDLVLVMTKSPEFEQSARLRVTEWNPDKIVGEIFFIDGRTYKMTVEVSK